MTYLLNLRRKVRVLLSTFRQKSRVVHSNISREYSLLAWVVATFVGGSINSLVLRHFVGYYWENYSHLHLDQIIDFLPELIVPFVGLFVTPILLSLIFTKMVSKYEKRIVPPLYLQIIAVTLFFVFGYYRREIAENLQVIWILFSYVLFVGLTQDRIVKSTVGRSGSKDNLFKASLKAKSDLETVKKMFLIEPVRATFGIVGIPEETARGLLFRSKADKMHIIFELEMNAKNRKETFINIVAFERRRYSIECTKPLEEYARSKVAYLRDVFSRSEHLIKLEKAPIYKVQSLSNLVVDEEMMGIASHMAGISRGGWIKTSAFILSMIIVIGALFYWERPEALAILVMFLLYVAFDLPSRLLSRRR